VGLATRKVTEDEEGNRKQSIATFQNESFFLATMRVVFWAGAGFLSGCSSFVLKSSSHHSYVSLTQLSVVSRPTDVVVGEVFSFEDMTKLEKRVSTLEESAAESLMDFYEPHLSSFSINPGRTDQISITSTCYAIRAILTSDTPSAYKAVDISKLLKELVNASWQESDLYQVSLMLGVLLKPDNRKDIFASFDDETLDRVSKLISLTLTARPKRRFNEQQVFSDYINYLCASVYSSLFDATHYDANGQLLLGDLPASTTPDGASAELSLAVLRAAEISFNELCRQLAYRSADESTFFDTTRLAYSLLTYIRSTRSLEGTAGRETVIGAGPDENTVPPKTNRKIIKAALSAFFAEQRDDGLWERGQPIYKSFRKQGRNVGNAYVFSVDTIGSMLEILPAEDFRPHLGSLQKMLEWIESNQVAEVVPDYCDPESGQCYGKSLRGWVSPHLPPGTGPQAWSTAQTATCLYRLKRVVQQLMHNDVLEEFNGIAHSLRGPEPAAWDRLLDSDLGGSGKDCRTIKSVLDERVCDPFHESITNPSVGAVYSAILFGSPGTAKTTICEAVSEKMGWDFVVIDTAAFLADGLTNVAARIRYVFDRLQALRECVILFDEIEEFCLDRETPGISMESRMLTTAMLTAINDLRRTKQSVFFLATNRLRAFDAAIIRPGRFDIQLFVGTPNLESRVVLLEEALEKRSVVGETKEAALQEFRDFMDSAWSLEGDALFMNYLEGKQFATAIANIVASGRPLEQVELQRILDQQAIVMTCRGAVREEYKAQMELSRL
jgi:hypothetical protein